MSSEKSNDKLFFRRHTQSNNSKKKGKSNSVKIKNDDVSRIFSLFQHASIENSIVIANAFTEARSNFHKHIVLDKSTVQAEKKDDNFGLLSELHIKNYDKQLNKMRRDSLSLNKIRNRISTKSSKFKSMNKGNDESNDLSLNEFDSKKNKKSEFQILGDNKHLLEIVQLSILDSYLLVSFFNREIRLLQLKKGLSTIKTEILF